MDGKKSPSVCLCWELNMRLHSAQSNLVERLGHIIGSYVLLLRISNYGADCYSFLTPVTRGHGFKPWKQPLTEMQESAIRERKKGKQTVKQNDTLENLSTTSDIVSSRLKGKKVQNATDIELRLQNTGSSATKIQSLKKEPKFSPLVFYGSPHGVPPKRPAHLLRLLNEIRVDFNEQNKVRKDVWVTFPRQDEAMKYAKEQTNARVFSYQDHMSGQRRFLVSTYKEFWRRYETMNPKFRHHYEVIQEGLPCHLYFDLEFNKRENANKNGDEMVDLLIEIIFDAVKEKYCLEGNNDWVVELDSSNEGRVFNGWF
ncbi:hypothetical protein CQW23_17394 [Capsicum baccatum]|uniref:DNA-directed primase/polymerase protein n=1 Tax=Capsicum baccatum TaxID=33114 RepID=A0A2G2WDX2_CAPBA|nr:hypothetical protein CQW23_17394 [Capsicum baccatum]